MKTTIDIEDRLYQQAMKQAEQDDRTLSDLDESTLQVHLRDSPPFDLKWVSTRGEPMPGIDIKSRDSFCGFSVRNPDSD